MADGAAEAVIRAAGGIVWRTGPAGLEVAIVHRPKYDDWSYPKGKCEPGEHILRTAMREVAEETGAEVLLGRALRTLTYRTQAGVKQVSYWVARCTDPGSFVPNREIDDLRWRPASTVGGELSYPADAGLARDFLAAPAATVPFILLRHASAGEKAADGDDLARPLDAAGAADAQLLASLLSCYERCQVISSPAERCLATVRPYAALAGVPVTVEPVFTSPDYAVPQDALAMAGKAGAGRPAADGIADVAARCADLASSGVPTLVCAHRENLPAMLDAACRALGASPPAGRPLAKGGFWVLQSAGGVLASAERHDTLA
jgi:8-oxo-(d)GTP phosphatase